MDSTTQIVVRTERGWAGHFCGSCYCGFRRNTLLEYGNTRIVVSTVGNYRPPPKEELETIGYKRYYETMVFGAKKEGPYWEADVNQQYNIENPCGINADIPECLPDDVDNKANLLHETIVEEFIDKLLTGKIK